MRPIALINRPMIFSFLIKIYKKKVINFFQLTFFRNRLIFSGFEEVSFLKTQDFEAFPASFAFLKEFYYFQP